MIRTRDDLLRNALGKSENGFATEGAIIDLPEGLYRFAQCEAFDDGNGFEGAGFEAGGQLFQDGGAGHCVIGTRIDTEKAEAAVIEIGQIERDAAVADGSDIDLTAELAKGAETWFEQRAANAIENNVDTSGGGKLHRAIEHILKVEVGVGDQEVIDSIFGSTLLRDW